VDTRPRAHGGYLAAIHARWLAEHPEQRWQQVDGSLLFVDVSGFTQLSERLARLGPIGAEELTELINAVFDGMLADVHRFGGDGLKFGGDALLALYHGPDHEARACASAARIQEGMRPFRNRRLDVGRVSLKVSAGIASGTIDLYLAGAGHYELIVAGPVASETIALESLAGPGQVVISERTAANLPRLCVGDPIGAGVLLDAVPQSEPVGPPARPDELDPTPGLPPHLHDHEPGDGEHRVVNVAFLQFKGVGKLMHERGRLAVADALDELLSACDEACSAHGITFIGTDIDGDGGKVILATGAPVASPDASERLLRGLRAALDRDYALTVRAGVNRGRVFVHDVGNHERMSWTVMGDEVNLAARVMGKAEPGQVLATTAVLDTARDAFVCTPVEPFLVKGKRHPVSAEVVDAEQAHNPYQALTAGRVIVGRDEELTIIRDALAAARAGAGATVELVGEPGMGKTHLLRAVLAEVSDLLIIGVEVGPYARFSPYLAVRRPLRELLGVQHDDPDEVIVAALKDAVARVAPELEPWLPLIALAFGVDIDETPESSELSPEFRRGRLLEATSAFLDALLGDTPLALVIEDAHWVDDASARLLEHVIGNVRHRHRVVLLTRRPVTTGLVLPGRHVVRLDIGPLTDRAARRIVTDAEAETGEILEPHLEKVLLERAAGNPLLLQELVMAALAGGDADALPDTVEALVTARIDTLGDGDRRFLRQVSVLGFHVQVPVLQTVLGLDAGDARAAIDRLDGFFEYTAPDRITFRHALIRDAAYGALPFRRRRELHARAADVLLDAVGADAAEEASLLALHEHAAGMWDRAWTHARAAGERALAQAAPVEAARFLQMALEAARHLPQTPGPEIAATADLLAEAQQRAGHLDGAAEAYRQARRAVDGDHLAQAELCRKEGRLRERSKSYSLALRWYTRAHRLIAHLEEDDEVVGLRARLLNAQAAARLRQGRMREAIPLLEESVRAAQRVDDRAALGHAYYLHDWAHTELGSPEAGRYRDLALPIFEELGDLRSQAIVLNNLGVDAYYEGRWDEAAEFYRRALEANDRVGDTGDGGMVRNNIAEIRLDQGYYDDAERLLGEALRAARAASFSMLVGAVTQNLGRLHALQGDLDRAKELYDDARDLLAGIGSEKHRLEVGAREAERLVLAGSPRRALVIAGAVRDDATRLGAEPRVLAMLQRIAALAKLQSGDREGAVQRLHEAIEIARGSDAAYEELLSLELLGRLGDAESEQAAAALGTRLGIITCRVVPLASK
jgi:class 3 adenylate cyclase/tetratricopeptide (TPR) repeat protein